MAIAASEKFLPYRAKIDGLRGVAILMVVIYHYFPSIMPMGFVGVDLFFVISGYLISQVLFNSKINFLEFYFRRARRLGPALVIAGFFILSISLPHNWPFELVSIGKQALSTAFFSPNIYYFLTESNYFINKDPTVIPFRHYWSLGVEEQFYLFYPLMLVLIGQARNRSQLTRFVLLSLWILSFGLMMILHGRTAAFYLPLARAWELLSGCLLAHQEKHGFQKQNLLILLFFVFLGAVYSFMMGIGPWPNLWATIPVAAGALLLAIPDESFIGKLLSRKMIVFIGLISYPLYLFHPATANLLSLFHLNQPIIEGLAAFVLSVFLAYLVWRFVETPIRGIRFSSLRPRQALIAILAPSVIIGCIGIIFISTNGFRGFYKISNYEETIAQFDVTKNPDKVASWLDEFRLFRFHLRSGMFLSTGNFMDTSTLILGDSHAWHLFYGLSRLPDLSKDGISVIARGTTPTLSDVELVYENGERLGAANWNNNLNRFISSTTKKKPKLIILSFVGPALFHGKGIGNLERTPITLESEKFKEHSAESIFYRGFSETLSNIYRSNKNNRVVFSMDIPEMPFEPKPHIQVKDHKVTFGVDSFISKEKTLERQVEIRRAISRVKQDFPNLYVFDPLSCFCDNDNCYAFKNGELFYFDSAHLTPLGSVAFAKCFSKFINENGITTKF